MHFQQTDTPSTKMRHFHAGMGMVAMVVQTWAMWKGCDMLFDKLRVRHVCACGILAVTFLIFFLVGMKCRQAPSQKEH
jgi:hypothetical protein